MKVCILSVSWKYIRMYACMMLIYLQIHTWTPGIYKLEKRHIFWSLHRTVGLEIDYTKHLVECRTRSWFTLWPKHILMLCHPQIQRICHHFNSYIALRFGSTHFHMVIPWQLLEDNCQGWPEANEQLWIPMVLTRFRLRWKMHGSLVQGQQGAQWKLSKHEIRKKTKSN